MQIPIELGIGGAFAIAVLSVVFGFLLKMRLKDRNGNSNKKSNPLCLDHESRISSNEACIKNIDKNIGELKSDNKKIVEGIGAIKLAIAKGD